MDLEFITKIVQRSWKTLDALAEWYQQDVLFFPNVAIPDTRLRRWLSFIAGKKNNSNGMDDAKALLRLFLSVFLFLFQLPYFLYLFTHTH